MILVGSKESMEVFFQIEKDTIDYEKKNGISYCPDVEDAPCYRITGLDDTMVDWNTVRKSRKKKGRLAIQDFGAEVLCEENSAETVMKNEGICVRRCASVKTFRPLLLPAPEISGNNDDVIYIKGEAVASAVSAVPKGMIVTKGRVIDFLTFVYSRYYRCAEIDVDKNWKWYDTTGGNYYRLYKHRMIDDNWEINGNGMSCYRGKTFTRRNDAEKLQSEGVPTTEINYRCYVCEADSFEYDFSNLIIGVLKPEEDE